MADGVRYINGVPYCWWCGKRCYTKQEGQATVRAFRATGGKRGKTPARIYECRYCNMYHLTHLRGQKKNIKKKGISY